MGRETGISWTDSTWNPIRGCSRVSEGCRNCYAESVAYRFSGPGLPYEGLVDISIAKADYNDKTDVLKRKYRGKWNGHIKFVEEHLLDPLKWKPVKFECQACGTDHLPKNCEIGLSRPRRIFVNSMSDLFHENVTDEMRDKIFAVMALCPQHTFQVLTKRPERMLAYLTSHGRCSQVYNQATPIIDGDFTRMPKEMPHHRSSGEGWWPLPNVHLGVSVEDQKTADLRIPLLLQTPAAVRFISAEPLLGPVNLGHGCADGLPVFMTKNARMRGMPAGNDLGPIADGWYKHHGNIHPWLDWVIVGGESGPGARPMYPDWARSLRDQCKAAGVPFFFKQWGEYKQATEVVEGFSRSTGNFETVPASNVFLRVGTKAAGCLLDGVEHHEFPAVSA